MIRASTLALFALLVAGWTPVDAQIVAVGVVTDRRDGQAVEEVRVVLSKISGEVDSVVVTTDEAGRFAALLPGPGSYELTARREGYEPLTFSPIEATEGGGEIELVVDLTPISIEIEGIEVEVEGDPRDPLEEQALALTRFFNERMLEMNGFNRRAQSGIGTQLGPEDLVDRRYSLWTLLRGIPAVTVLRGGRGLRVGWPPCNPEIFIDGRSTFGGEFRNVVHSLRRVLAVEVYTRPSEVPEEFRGRFNENCGVILVWVTRRAG